MQGATARTGRTVRILRRFIALQMPVRRNLDPSALIRFVFGGAAQKIDLLIGQRVRKPDAGKGIIEPGNVPLEPDVTQLNLYAAPPSDKVIMPAFEALAADIDNEEIALLSANAKRQLLLACMTLAPAAALCFSPPRQKGEDRKGSDAQTSNKTGTPVSHEVETETAIALPCDRWLISPGVAGYLANARSGSAGWFRRLRRGRGFGFRCRVDRPAGRA